MFTIILIFLCLFTIITIVSFKNTTNIQLVISRYNEDLEWLKNEPFSKYQNIIYNKGPNDDFYSNEKSTIIKLDNIGREGETYLYHIIHNYNNLLDVTIFLPGSLNIPYKYVKAKMLTEEVENHKDTVFVSEYFNNVKEDFYEFQLDEYISTDLTNKMINSENILVPSKIRPFGKWFEYTFGDIVIHNVSWTGIIGIGKQDIIQHPKLYYINLYKHFKNKKSNPEVGHYFERSWEAVFYPLNNPKIVSDWYIKFFFI